MTHNTREVEEFATQLSKSVRYSSGRGQYDAFPDCQAAYLDGVETAIAMMYIDLTGGHKSKGVLGRLFATSSQQVEEAVRNMQERCAVEVWRTWSGIDNPMEDTPVTRALSEATKRIRAITPNHQD